jgi:crotonobetainyl-CoA:carnitine CoA-transferase CaiB-like acyl-CoA transferase
MLLAALGADVVKVEAPGEGDYIRRMAWPFVDGVSLLHWHVNRGKRSVVLDLTKTDGKEAFLDLVRTADVVVEGMRPGALERRGLGYERLLSVKSDLVVCSISGYGATGPYRDAPSHGVGFDAWAGTAPPGSDDEGRPFIPDLTPIGTRAAPAFAAMAILAGVVRARATGRGCSVDVAQSDVAAACNWLAIEGARAYERPEDQVTGNPADGGRRRPLGLGGMREGVRYQYYRSKDGHVLFMASERAFWENFCRGIDRMDLFAAHPGSEFADHAVGEVGLRDELAEVFAQRTTAEWVAFGIEVNTPIGAVNDSVSILDDPQFVERFSWTPAEEAGADLMSLPVRFIDAELPFLRRAPTLGEDTKAVLAELAGYGEGQIEAQRAAGAVPEDG